MKKQKQTLFFFLCMVLAVTFTLFTCCNRIELVQATSQHDQSTPVGWKKAIISSSSSQPSFVQAEEKRMGGIFGNNDGELNDANNEKVAKIEPNQRVFGQHNFPGQYPDDLQRRAVYGARRRRMPYDVSSEFRSANPYRQVNNWRNSPDDVMFPRVGPWASIKNPFVGDYARTFGYGGNYYGGYSSFGPNRGRNSILSLRGSSASSSRSSGESSMPVLPSGVRPFAPSFLPPVINRGPTALSSYRAAGFRRSVADMPPEFALEYPQAFGFSVGDPALDWSSRDFHPSAYYLAKSAFNPLANGPSPYVPGGDYKFYDFYAGTGETSQPA